MYSTSPHNMVIFGPLVAEIVSLGTPCNFNGFRVLAALLHSALVVGVSQFLRRWTEGATYIRQGGHHVGHWPTFLVLFAFLRYYIVINIIPNFWRPNHAPAPGILKHIRDMQDAHMTRCHVMSHVHRPHTRTHWHIHAYISPNMTHYRLSALVSADRHLSIIESTRVMACHLLSNNVVGHVQDTRDNANTSSGLYCYFDFVQRRTAVLCKGSLNALNWTAPDLLWLGGPCLCTVIFR